MATPVVPTQFAVGKNRIIHKPTTATLSFETPPMIDAPTTGFSASTTDHRNWVLRCSRRPCLRLTPATLPADSGCPTFASALFSLSLKAKTVIRGKFKVGHR